MNKAYRYRLYPNKKQEELFAKTFGCVRFVYNKMLDERQAIYNKYKEDKDTLKKQKLPTPAKYKDEFEWLREVDALALCNAQLNLNTAYRNFFRDKSVGFPNFKSRKNPVQSYTTNNQKGSIRIVDNKNIRLPKVGLVRVKLHRQIPKDAVVKSATISRSSTNKYYVSILVELNVSIKPIKLTKDKTIGMDYASACLFVDSNGASADYPRYYRQMESKLKAEQRKLSKMIKGSNNRRAQCLRVAKIHEKVSNQRKDFLHKLSRQIANAYDAVVVENINMKEISQSLYLGKATNDNGFGMLKNFLSYKLAEQGKTMVVVDKWFPSSKLCHACGCINDKLTLKDREWVCSCGLKLNRDRNAAINIKNEGCRMLGIA